ncbi:MAG TPA: hypothetical protein VNB90_15135 [Cytophagaceae bacterium]|jgi:hypothetical protein|nr:hypothetical protein [Cytophagaceae bacterium]
MTLQQEYQRLCQAIDQVQWQMFKQGKKHNEFMQRELVRLQEQMKQLYRLATGKVIQHKQRAEGQRAERRSDYERDE